MAKHFKHTKDTVAVKNVLHVMKLSLSLSLTHTHTHTHHTALSKEHRLIYIHMHPLSGILAEALTSTCPRHLIHTCILPHGRFSMLTRLTNQLMSRACALICWYVCVCTSVGTYTEDLVNATSHHTILALLGERDFRTKEPNIDKLGCLRHVNSFGYTHCRETGKRERERKGKERERGWGEGKREKQKRERKRRGKREKKGQE